MKIVGIIALVLGIIFIGFQIWAYMQSSGIEQYPYKVVKSYDAFEVRQYESANFIYATIDAKNYEQTSSGGFRILAGYIFGGNESNQKIAMTSPVVMDMDEKTTIKFLVPAQYDLNEMPKPKDAKVEFKTEEEKRMAAIRFGGFANDEKIAEYKDKLFAALEAEGIAHTGDWSFMGYNSPWELVGRRNEVVVELSSS